MKEMVPKIEMIPKGHIRFTKDPLSIENLDHSEIKSPFILNTPKFVKSERDQN